METLLAGFRAFRETAFLDHEARFRMLAQTGQSPKAMVIACCDSRVDPQLIFHAAPGDLFIIRNVANLVPPYAPNSDYHGTSAALEFGVCQLNVPHVVVMGHTGCGGVGALLQQDYGGEYDFIGHWMSIAKPVRDGLQMHGRPATDEDRATAERRIVGLSLANLMTFPWIRDRVGTGALKLHGCVFDVAAADLLCLNPADGAFQSIIHRSDEP